LVCVKNACGCEDGFEYDDYSEECKKSRGQSCEAKSECKEYATCDSNRKCSCEYPNDYFYDEEQQKCAEKRYFGDECDSSEMCSSNLTCEKKSCGCGDGLKYIDSILYYGCSYYR
jgi:hypothetical protein